MSCNLKIKIINYFIQSFLNTYDTEFRLIYIIIVIRPFKYVMFFMQICKYRLYIRYTNL